MTQLTFSKTIGLAAICSCLLMTYTSRDTQAQDRTVTPDSYSWNNRPPDPQLKADILVVVAHPDDETMVTSYLAREIYDHHKRVAVAFENRGDGGNNDVGPEQAEALGDIREVEARRAVALLGITNVWFLSGRDTASQNVLTSLEHCGHGRCLDQLVRIVRITRPSVILTWLPDFTTGENHADHQAAGVLATEAFDLAGDPTAFPEQVSPATEPDKTGNMTEGLRPWQPQKVYYFYNPTHNDIFAGQGPQYSANDLSPSRHVSYGELAAQVFTYHRTQGGTAVADELANHSLNTASGGISSIITGPVRFIMGKSLVSSGVTEDVFTGVIPDGIPYQHPHGYIPAKYTNPVLEIGDPWSFYHKLWQAHGLEHLANIVAPEVSIKVGGTLAIPLVIENPLDQPIAVSLSVHAPDGWNVRPVAAQAVPPHSRYYLRVLAAAPATKLPGWQHFTVSATSAGKSLGSVSLRVELSTGWVAPQ